MFVCFHVYLHYCEEQYTLCIIYNHSNCIVLLNLCQFKKKHKLTDNIYQKGMTCAKHFKKIIYICCLGQRRFLMVLFRKTCSI